jgi:ribonuclease R
MFQLGDRVEVKLLEVAPVSGGLRFEMISDGRKGKAQPNQRRSRPVRVSNQTSKSQRKK